MLSMFQVTGIRNCLSIINSLFRGLSFVVRCAPQVTILASSYHPIVLSHQDVCLDPLCAVVSQVCIKCNRAGLEQDHDSGTAELQTPSELVPQASFKQQRVHMHRASTHGIACMYPSSSPCTDQNVSSKKQHASTSTFAIVSPTDLVITVDPTHVAPTAA